VNTDDLAWLRTCGAAGIEKEGKNCERRRGPEKWDDLWCTTPEVIPFFRAPSTPQVPPSFSMPAAPQVRSHARSDGGDGGKASGSARRRIGVSMWGWEDGWKGVWIRQEGGSV